MSMGIASSNPSTSAWIISGAFSIRMGKASIRPKASATIKSMAA